MSHKLYYLYLDDDQFSSVMEAIESPALTTELLSQLSHIRNSLNQQYKIHILSGSENLKGPEKINQTFP